MTNNKSTGIVFNIQRFTVHDGPGIRTEFFLKGCPLRCKWCGNPESFSAKTEVGVFPQRCIGVSKCGDCIKACPQEKGEMFSIEDDKVTGINRDLCTGCAKCYDACPVDALKLWGEDISVEEAMEIVLKDKNYYKDNNGGVTVSGGEALMQPEFIKELFKRCQEEGVHTCLESALHIKSEIINSVLPYTDMLITDIKHMDDKIHKENTGVGNKLVLENIIEISKTDIPIILRIPVIPGFNDNEKAISDIGDFVVDKMNNRVAQLQMLRFRPLGKEKYDALSMPYVMEITKERANFEEEIRSFVKILKAKGINAFAGSTEKIDI